MQATIQDNAHACKPKENPRRRALGEMDRKDKRGARVGDGSGTCRRKARLDGRHTSDGVCAAARSKQPQHVTPFGTKADR
jgi:hypothetical protein